MKLILVLTAIAAFATTALAQTGTTTTETATSIPSGTAKRAVFCTSVAEREPLDDLTTLAAPADKVYFFTEIIGMTGRTVTHKWSHDGQGMGDVVISVGADRWRCYSVKTLSSDMTGTWTVEVVDDAGTKIAEKSITYTAAP